TVTFAVLVSLFVSFTLDPMLSSRWFDPDIERVGKRHLVARILDRFNDRFERMAETYRHMIGWALDHRPTMMVLATVTFLGGLYAFASLQSTFMPEYDKAEFQVNFQTAPNSSLAETRSLVEELVKRVAKIKEVDHTYATIGAGDTGTVRDAMVYLKLVEMKHRRRTQTDIQRQVREIALQLPGVMPSIMEVGRLDGNKMLVVNIRGEDVAQLKRYAAQLKSKMSEVRGIVDIEYTLEHDVPEYRLKVDQKKAQDVDVNTQSIVKTVRALIGGEAVSTYEDEDGDAVNLRVRMPGELRQDPNNLNRLYVTVSKSGAKSVLVPLQEIVSYELHNTPSEISRQELTRQVVVSANLDNLPLGTAVKETARVAKEISMAPGYRVVFSGEAEDMAESFMYMFESLLLAVVFVYLILAAQFESFVEPLSIMLSLPLSIVGMAGMLFVTNDTISIMSLIGLIMLMGLVTKNAILLVDYAKILRARGEERRQAVITAGRTRLRPILMTTLAMIFGMTPLALGLGPGAEMRAPMGRAVIGGLITSTLLTLLVVPVMYTLLDDLTTWVRRRFSRKDQVGKPAEVMTDLIKASDRGYE
ncbi:MAG: efflux RND transporter permease subunit, partial [Deltaproteobacteria bacterium]|nr:efflux RND transporter permease subunit [Deltaproteobacteria bacterium]